MTAHLVLCGGGAALAMIGHFPQRARLWLPHALGVAAMVLAGLPAAQPVGEPAALAALAVVLGWQLRSVRASRVGWSGVADTAAMAALIGLSGLDPAAPAAGAAPMPGMHPAAAGSTLPYAVAVVVVWLYVRHLIGRAEGAGPGAPDVPGTAGSAGRVLGAVRLCGGVVMLTTMTAMLA